MKNWFTSIIGDKEYDPDASKIVGMILCVVAIDDNNYTHIGHQV